MSLEELVTILQSVEMPACSKHNVVLVDNLCVCCVGHRAGPRKART